jgi:hypothetical protein
VLKNELALSCNYIAVFLLSCFLVTVATNAQTAAPRKSATALGMQVNVAVWRPAIPQQGKEAEREEIRTAF